MDRWGNVVYLTPMALGALASLFAAAWRFLGVRSKDTPQNMLEQLAVLREKIRDLEDEADLRRIEDEIDAVLRARLAKSADDEEGGTEALALIAIAQRLDNLVHHRRSVLAARASDNASTG
jgi:hypothetical protein